MVDDSAGVLIGTLNLTNTTAGAPTWKDQQAQAYTLPPTADDGKGLVVTNILVTNAHATVDAIVSIYIGSDLLGDMGFAKAAGGGFEVDLSGAPIYVAPGQTLKFKSSASANIQVFVVARLAKG